MNNIELLRSASARIDTMIDDLDKLTMDDVVHPPSPQPKALADWVLTWGPDLGSRISDLLVDYADRLAAGYPPVTVDLERALAIARLVLKEDS